MKEVDRTNRLEAKTNHNTHWINGKILRKSEKKQPTNNND